MKNEKVSTIITDQIISNLENKGKWVSGWESLQAQNGISKRLYTGTNSLLLAQMIDEKGFNHPQFYTYKQVTSKGGTVIKGQKATKVIFWKILEIKDKETSEIVEIPMMRYYNVFNIDQTTLEKPEHNTVEIKEKFLTMKNDYLKRESIQVNKGEPCYIPSKHIIRMPAANSFDSASRYQSVLAHEMIHSTKKALGRKFSDGDMRSDTYAKEELIAELGALFLLARLGLDYDINNSQQYINSWIKRLKQDPAMIISASSQANKAVDYILNEHKR